MRDGNQVVHSLTRYAIGIPNFLVWIEDVLSQILFILQANLIGLH